jgi:RHS repeat-associated protein
MVKTVDGGLVEYRYDASGKRIKKIAGSTTYFVMGAGEYQSGSWTKLYVNIAEKKMVEYSNNKTYFYAHDHLGSPAVITDNTGAVVATYRHYPFGEQWITTGTKSDRHRFTGKELDTETGLNYHGARYLSTSYGRWTSVDPVLGNISNPQRLNRFRYVLNDPVNFVDPDGTFELRAPRGFGTPLGPLREFSTTPRDFALKDPYLSGGSSGRGGNNANRSEEEDIDDTGGGGVCTNDPVEVADTEKPCRVISTESQCTRTHRACAPGWGYWDLWECGVIGPGFSYVWCRDVYLCIIWNHCDDGRVIIEEKTITESYCIGDKNLVGPVFT